MAVDKPSSANARKGAMGKPTQLKTPAMDQNRISNRLKGFGQFMDQKQDGKKFKGVRKEH